MKTAISIPDTVFEEADKLADRLGLSRSELYVRAIQRFLEEHRDSYVTERLNAVYVNESSELDPVVGELQTESTRDEDW